MAHRLRNQSFDIGAQHCQLVMAGRGARVNVGRERRRGDGDSCMYAAGGYEMHLLVMCVAYALKCSMVNGRGGEAR